MEISSIIYKKNYVYKVLNFLKKDTSTFLRFIIDETVKCIVKQ